jgi:hypothetical protein
VDSNTYTYLLSYCEFVPALGNAGACVTRLAAEFLLDLQKAVVLGDPFAAAGRPRLDLAIPAATARSAMRV